MATLSATGSDSETSADADAEAALDATPRIISCSILVRQPDQAHILQVIPRLVIDGSQVVAREDASSVRIASLILALRTGIEFQGFHIEEPLLASLITGTIHCPNLVSVSTTRIPDFSGSVYKEASSGYQFLGWLSQVNADAVDNCTQHTAVYTSGELISAAHTSKSADFFSTYRPMNVIPESHFILIFTLHEESPNHGSSDSDIYSTFSSTYTSDAEVASSDFDVYSLDGIATSFTSGPALSEVSEWTLSQSMYPISLPCVGDPNVPLTNGAVSAASPRPSPYPAPSRSRSGSVSGEEKILLLLSSLQPPVAHTVLRDAKYVRQNISLSGMIRNHRSMGMLLDICGVNSSTTKTFTDLSAQTHSLTSKSVFGACGWSESTFGNKTSLYQNSEKAAKMSWSGVVPPEGTEGRTVYDAWQGMIYLWSPIGPILTGMESSASSLDASERLAASLTQKSLEKVAGTAFRKSSLTVPPAL
ncbi:hypothetical protein B0H19DRAFT_92645 [Mycena capillaripes]|nr:hypothetical protein B0H19DRAFT_92645 [Mycena capillaripes]